MFKLHLPTVRSEGIVNPRRVVLLAPAIITAAAVTLWPVKASAQWHGGHSHVSVGIGIGVGYGHPFYGAPYFYSPFWWGYGGFYSGFYGYPYYAYAPYAAYGPYPGYGGYWDASADLRVQVTPRTAEVYVDGYLVGGVDDFDGTFQRLHMPLGEHEVSIYQPGYRTITQRMLFRPWSSYKIKETMQALPAGQDEPRPVPAPRTESQNPPPRGMAPPAYSRDRNPDNSVQIQPGGGDRFGAVAIRVQPVDAEVWIDGERWEASNGERVLVQLTDGVHRVEVRKTGFRTYSSTVRVRSGETVTLNVSLSQSDQRPL